MMDKSEGVNDAFIDLMRRQTEAQAVHEGDHYEDGLLICGKCGELRQGYEYIDGVRVIVPCKCACDRAEDDAEKERGRLAGTAARRVASCIPKRYADASFGAWDGDGKIMDACKRYAEGFESYNQGDHMGLLFYGNLGNGKTFMACSVANALIDRGYRAVFISVPDYISLDADAADRQRRRAEAADITVLDDLGAERDTAYGAERTYTLINGLYNEEACVIATTNYTMADMKGGSRTVNRLLEMCHPIQFTGANRRNRIAAARFDRIHRQFGV